MSYLSGLLKRDHMLKRLFMTLLGLFITALSVALFRRVAWGMDPFNCLIAAVQYITGLAYGIAFPLVQGILLVITFFLGRHYISLGTLLTLFCLGGTVDFLSIGVTALFPAPGLWVRVVLFCLSFLLVCFGAALYITSDLGVSSYDAISLMMADYNVGKFRWCRIFTDCVCMVSGLLTHANVGIMTILTAFFMGPLVSWMQQKFTVPMLEGSSAPRAK